MGLWIAVALGGFVAVIAGAAMKPSGAYLQWSRFWGFSTNSTAVGKLVYMCGSAALVVGTYQMLVLASTPAPDPLEGLDATAKLEIATVSGWESTGILRIGTAVGTCRCFFEPTWHKSEPLKLARTQWRKNARIRGWCGPEASAKYQTPGETPVRLCKLETENGAPFALDWMIAH